MNKVYHRRFQELAEQLVMLENTKEIYYSNYYNENQTRVDETLLLNWKVKVRNLLVKVCGEDSQHFCQFEKTEFQPYCTNYDSLQSMNAVFMAAKEDFEGGYLTSIRSLVQAEVFDSELEQAQELLKSGYVTAAAVITGVVLETALRDLCDRSAISYGKLDKMNADLTKANVYSKLIQKRITTLANIRNSAAHGKPEEFTEQDVSTMIRDVGDFLIDHLSA